MSYFNTKLIFEYKFISSKTTEIKKNPDRPAAPMAPMDMGNNIWEDRLTHFMLYNYNPSKKPSMAPNLVLGVGKILIQQG